MEEQKKYSNTKKKCKKVGVELFLGLVGVRGRFSIALRRRRARFGLISMHGMNKNSEIGLQNVSTPFYR